MSSKSSLFRDLNTGNLFIVSNVKPVVQHKFKEPEEVPNLEIIHTFNTEITFKEIQKLFPELFI